MEVHLVSVKELVMFLHASGDMETQTKRKHARLIGRRLHSEHQSTYANGDDAEVLVRGRFEKTDYVLEVSGRIDGVLRRDGEVIVEEIKSTETALSLLKEDTFPAHINQARFYAYLYAKDHDLSSVNVRLTYIHHPSKEKKRFETRSTFKQLEENAHALIDAYLQWLHIYERHQYEKRRSLQGLAFPFDDYREGQYHFMGAVYQTLVKEEILYATAPTGIGKTVAALYSGLKTLSNESEKLFYLTAKNAGKSIAVQMVERMKDRGLIVKAITLNSKETMCLQDEVDCDPEICPYAKGFYNRLRKALEDIFVHDDVYEAKLIKQYGEYHTICPHEFALEISNYCDIVICDFNYVFDPRIRLIRYFEESAYEPRLLVDEAHNLIDRSRSMYSAELSQQAMQELFREIQSMKPSPKRALTDVLGWMEEAVANSEVEKSRFHAEDTLDNDFLSRLHHAALQLEKLLETHKKHKKRKHVREGYFTIAQFLRIAEFFGDAFRFVLEKDGEDVLFRIVCLDASKPLSEVIRERTKGAVLFSATLKPAAYYAALITRGEGRHFEVPSPFDPKKLGVLIDVSTSTKYRDRKYSINRIVDTLYALLETKTGNYIVFFPSYEYLEMVYERFDKSGYIVMKQRRGMAHFEREEFLEEFKAEAKKSKLLFSVLGGSFSEGVDYMGDALSGVFVVGVALPAFNRINEMIKDHYYSEGYNGFDYAYTYPGMRKVVQAVGRVIRSEEDKGLAILMDTRYEEPKYEALLPSHWQPVRVYEDHYIQDFIRMFWEKFSTEK